MDNLSPSGFYWGVLKELGRNLLGLFGIFVVAWIVLIVGAFVLSCLIKWLGFLGFATIGAIIILVFAFAVSV